MTFVGNLEISAGVFLLGAACFVGGWVAHAQRVRRPRGRAIDLRPPYSLPNERHEAGRLRW